MSFSKNTCSRGHEYSYPGENDDPGCFDCDRIEMDLIESLMSEAHNVVQSSRLPKLEAALVALRDWYS